MERVCQQKTGLFPSPNEIKLSCSCPDWADMCKHVAAVLYGIGARLDQQPDLLFRLHNLDEKELIAGAGKGIPQAKRAPASTKVLGGEDLSALFGLDMAEGTSAELPRGAAKKPKRSKAVTRKKAVAAVGGKAKAGAGVRRKQSTAAREHRGSKKVI
ncbi:MAG: SWIM zinc finger family protein [Bryobacteraceae bacterium]